MGVFPSGSPDLQNALLPRCCLSLPRSPGEGSTRLGCTPCYPSGIHSGLPWIQAKTTLGEPCLHGTDHPANKHLNMDGRGRLRPKGVLAVARRVTFTIIRAFPWTQSKLPR